MNRLRVKNRKIGVIKAKVKSPIPAFAGMTKFYFIKTRPT
jgi:hypothetical protein